jgi:hypothetical protein
MEEWVCLPSPATPLTNVHSSPSALSIHGFYICGSTHSSSTCYRWKIYLSSYSLKDAVQPHLHSIYIVSSTL